MHINHPRGRAAMSDKTNIIQFPQDVIWAKLIRESQRAYDMSEMLIQETEMMLNDMEELYEGFTFVLIDDFDPGDN